ncbi:MAG TPA: hypothetical protein PLO67_03065 [Saprospiraceae bacterium]|nr:hypothetical protein [Saprospiraceae bacterium]HPI06241.1 hypothetical protein [Saprospiraceae bacterium]
MDVKKFIPHLIAIAVLMFVSAVFFAPNAFSGKVLPQSDNDKARGMQTEIQDYMKKEGKAPLWTNSAFGGMPAYQIYSPVKGNLTKPLYKTLFLWTDITSIWAQVFVAMFCMYFFLSVLKLDWRVAIFGAVAFGITSYNIDILEAGHSTKMAALALAPGIFAGLAIAFNGRILLGAGVTALFVAMQLNANHVQITYYTLLVAGIYFLAQLVDAFRHKAFASWVKALAATGIAIAIGFVCNLSRIWPTYEYGKETIRGQSELSTKASKGDGLDKDYLFGWSYGVCESMTLLVPHAAGGGGNESYRNTELYKTLVRKYSQQMSPQQAAQQTGGLMYAGDQPFVGTAIYFGAIVCFLFFLGAFLVPGTAKWWMLGGGLFMVSLAWGKNFFLNDIWYDTLPMFNKFRAVSMALGMGQLCFAALAALGLQKLCDPDIALDRKKRALSIATGASVLLALLAFVCAPDAGPNDAALAQNPDLLSALKSDRASLLRSDVFRSLGFILAAAGLIWLYLQGKMKAGVTVLSVAALSLADHWMVCTRTISSDKYESKRAATAPPQPEAFDLQIQKDPDPDYRVLDLSRGGIPFNATTSYFHKSLSGYHAAKLQRYQEVVDTFLGKDLSSNLHIVGMLNGKYIITQKGEVVPNPEVCGNAWFVKHFDIVPTAEAEMNALHRLNPKDSAVIQQSFATPLQGLQIQTDSANFIRLSHYHPDKMEYEYSAKTEQLAVFSEIYYPADKGWKCYLNGQPAPDFIKANYLLRAMRLPAGQNMKLEMRFEPRSFYLGEKIAMGASFIALLLFFGGLYWLFRNGSMEDPNRLAENEPPAPAKPVAPVKSVKKK